MEADVMAVRVQVELILTGIQLDTIREANINIPQVCCEAVKQAIQDHQDMLMATSAYEKPREVKYAGQLICM